MFYHLLESSHRDDSNKWTNIGFEEITQVESIEVHFMHLIWSSETPTHHHEIILTEMTSWFMNNN